MLFSPGKHERDCRTYCVSINTNLKHRACGQCGLFFSLFLPCYLVSVCLLYVRRNTFVEVDGLRYESELSISNQEHAFFFIS